MGPRRHPDRAAAVSANYSPEEERALVRALAEGPDAACPACGARVELHDVPPREGVPYVRRRVLVVCGGCRRRVAVDRRAVERER